MKNNENKIVAVYSMNDVIVELTRAGYGCEKVTYIADGYRRMHKLSFEFVAGTDTVDRLDILKCMVGNMYPIKKMSRKNKLYIADSSSYVKEQHIEYVEKGVIKVIYTYIITLFYK